MPRMKHRSGSVSVTTKISSFVQFLRRAICLESHALQSPNKRFKILLYKFQSKLSPALGFCMSIVLVLVMVLLRSTKMPEVFVSSRSGLPNNLCTAARVTTIAEATAVIAIDVDRCR